MGAENCQVMELHGGGGGVESSSDGWGGVGVESSSDGWGGGIESQVMVGGGVLRVKWGGDVESHQVMVGGGCVESQVMVGVCVESQVVGWGGGG